MVEYKKILEWIGKYLPNPQAIQLSQWIDQLRKENGNLRDEINVLKKEVKELSSQAVQPFPDIPACPNCSTTERKTFMIPIPKDFVELEDATHECSQCGFKIKVE